MLGNNVFATDVTIGDVGVEFVKDSAKTPVNEDTAAKANNTPMPSGLFYKDVAGDYVPVSSVAGLPTLDADAIAELQAIKALLPVSLGQKLSAASMSVVLSTELEAKIDTIINSVAPKDIVAAMYWDTSKAGQEVTELGTVIGAVGQAVKAMTILNNANSVRVEIGGELAGISLPGSPLNVDVTTVSGNVVLKSLVGQDIAGGDFAINIEG